MTASSDADMAVYDATSLIKPFEAHLDDAPVMLAPERGSELLPAFRGKDIPEIAFHNNRPIVLKALPSKHEITASHSALLSLWATARAAFLIADAGIRASRSTVVKTKSEDSALSAGAALGRNHPAICEAYLLKAVAKKYVRQERTTWPTVLSRPVVEPAVGTLDAAVVNVFLGAGGWALLHEYAHIALGHDENAPDAQRLEYKMQADEWATKWVFDGLADPLKRRYGVSLPTGWPQKAFDWISDPWGTRRKTRWFRTFAVATGLCWLGINDLVHRGSTDHPHASQRFIACMPHFGGGDMNPGVEMASYVIKAFFDPGTPVPIFDTPAEALEQISMENWYRLER